jgi:hypothetical protein
VEEGDGGLTVFTTPAAGVVKGLVELLSGAAGLVEPVPFAAARAQKLGRLIGERLEAGREVRHGTMLMMVGKAAS